MVVCEERYTRPYNAQPNTKTSLLVQQRACNQQATGRTMDVYVRTYNTRLHYFPGTVDFPGHSRLLCPGHS